MTKQEMMRLIFRQRDGENIDAEINGMPAKDKTKFVEMWREFEHKCWGGHMYTVNTDSNNPM